MWGVCFTYWYLLYFLVGAGEMANWIKYLLGKQEDPDLDPSVRGKVRCGSTACKPITVGSRSLVDWQLLGHWLVCLAKVLSSRFSKRPSLKK